MPLWSAIPPLWWDGGLAKPSTTSSCKHPKRACHPSGMVHIHHSQRIPFFLPHLHTLTASQWQISVAMGISLHSCWRKENTMLETLVKLTGVLRGQEGNKGYFNVFYHLLQVFLPCCLHHQKTRCEAWKALPSSCSQARHSPPTASSPEPSLAAELADDKWMDPSWTWTTSPLHGAGSFLPSGI